MLTILCWPYDTDPTTLPNARCILWCSRSLSVEVRKTQLHLSTVKIQLSRQWSNLNWCLFKILFSGHDVIHTPAQFPAWGGLLLQMVIVISFARERKSAIINHAPGLLTRTEWYNMINVEGLILKKWFLNHITNDQTILFQTIQLSMSSMLNSSKYAGYNYHKSFCNIAIHEYVKCT